MANSIYGKAREKFLNPGTLGTTSATAIDWADDNIKVLLVDTGVYTVSIDVHEFHSDVTGIIATSGNLGTKTATLGVADAADITFTAVAPAASIEAIIIYKDTGTSATSSLIAYIDTGVTGLPVTPNGGDITLTFDSGANRIFKL